MIKMLTSLMQNFIALYFVYFNLSLSMMILKVFTSEYLVCTQERI